MKRHAAPLRSARRLAFAPACVGSCCVGALLLAGLLAGCSSRPIETGLSSHAEKMPVATNAAGTAGSDTRSHRPVRPIPEVIAKAKPFRMSQVNTTEADPLPTRAAISSGIETVSALMPSQAQPRSATGPDVSGITSMMQSYLQAFNRHDSAALAAHWSTAGENIDLDSGQTTAGREAVREVFAALFDHGRGIMLEEGGKHLANGLTAGGGLPGVEVDIFTGCAPVSGKGRRIMVIEDLLLQRLHEG